MSNQDIDKAYVSPYDKFFYEFDANHEKSASQRQEIEKHRRIAQRRDEANYTAGQEKIWEKF